MNLHRNSTRHAGRVKATARALYTAPALLLVALLAACTVGPDYRRPDPPQVPTFLRQDGPATPAPEPDPEFWRAFGDPLLARLIDDALRHNDDLRVAYANYQQANALLGSAKYDTWPTLSATAHAADVRSSADQMPGGARADRDHRDYDAGLGFSWEIDLFGRVRRGIEAQRAETEASAGDLAAMQVAAVGALATSYVQLRGWQDQLRIARASAERQARTLQLLQVRLQAGAATPFDVDRGRTQLETTRSRIPALEAEVAVLSHRIAVLTGRAPQALASELEQPGALPVWSHDIATGTPGELLRRRPDIAAAERRLAASTARIGVATADLFPHFTLGGLIGTQAFGAGALFSRDSQTRLLSLGIDGGFLNVGRVRARIAAANASASGDLATYDRTVLLALEETEDALVRLSRSAREASYLGEAAAAGARASAQAKLRFDHGAIDVLELLDAERAQLQAEDMAAQARMRHTLAAVALYQALAGGWPDRLPEEVAAVKSAS